MCQSPYYTLIWGSCEGGTIITNLQGKKLRMRAIGSFVHSLRTNELDLEQAGAFNHYAVLNRRKGKVTNNQLHRSNLCLASLFHHLKKKFIALIC